MSDESPYILKYTDAIYKQVLDANKKSKNDRNQYLISQSEFRDPEFIKILQDLIEKEKRDPSQRLILSWELCKYRINKSIPAWLPFDVRKMLFVKSDEFNGRIHQASVHKTESELTAENLQAEIDMAGIRAGMELENRFENQKIVKAFNEGYCELIIDRGDVKYK